jgi:hypoxanthine phosphoribosyltransferase
LAVGPLAGDSTLFQAGAIVKVLLTEDQLRRGVREMAQRIARDQQGRQLTIVGVLTGSLVLLADLIRHLEMPLRLGLVEASSYRGNATQPGALQINTALLPDVRGRHVLLVDDIFDTGQTLDALLAHLRSLLPASLRSAVLLRKLGRQQTEAQPDYVAFDIPNEFVVGYGLDYNDLYRNLPYVAALEAHEIEDARL